MTTAYACAPTGNGHNVRLLSDRPYLCIETDGSAGRPATNPHGNAPMLKLDDGLRGRAHGPLPVIERHGSSHDSFAGQRYRTADVALSADADCAPDGGIGIEPDPSIRRWPERIDATPGVAPMPAADADACARIAASS